MQAGAGGGVVVGERGGRRGRRLAILGDSVDTMGSQYITSPNPTPSSLLSRSLFSLSLSPLRLSFSRAHLFGCRRFCGAAPTRLPDAVIA